jgi:beta-N-acetylhexosaminidase
MTGGDAMPARTRAKPAVTLVLALCLALVAVSGCSQKLPTTTPGITGTITSLLPGTNGPANFLVQGNEQPAGAVSDKAQVTIGSQTRFFDRYGKRIPPRGIGVGTKVSVWFDGPVAESYPVQGTALAVQVFGK